MITDRPLTFLVVDDDISLSLFFKEALTKEGHRVFLAVSEHGALEILKSETVDILLCDFVLPGMDGGQIITIAKEWNSSLFCVMISGHQQMFTPAVTSGIAADMFIAKPILKETLTDVINHFHAVQTQRHQS